MKTFKEFYTEAHIDNLRIELEEKIKHCKDEEQLERLQLRLKELQDAENKTYK